MLATLLLLATTPPLAIPEASAASPQVQVPAPSARVITVDRMPADGTALSPYSSSPGLIGLTPDRCHNGPTLTLLPRTGAGDLLWRDGGQAVAHYRLLERRVNGCPAPIIIDYRVPGSNAIGREAIAPGRGDRLPVP